MSQDGPKMAPRCALRASWGLLGALLGPSWVHLGVILGHLGAILGHLGAILEPSWAILGHLGAILGPSWVIFGPSWAVVGHLGATLGHLGAILGHLGPICDHLGAILSCFVARSFTRPSMRPGGMREAIESAAPCRRQGGTGVLDPLQTLQTSSR